MYEKMVRLERFYLVISKEHEWSGQ